MANTALLTANGNWINQSLTYRSSHTERSTAWARGTLRRASMQVPFSLSSADPGALLLSNFNSVLEVFRAPRTADLLLGPCALAALSLLHLVFHATRSTKQETGVEYENNARGLRVEVASLGGWIGLALRTLRFAGSVALVILSAIAVGSAEEDSYWQANAELLAIMSYTSLLASATILGPSRTWRRLADGHISVILLGLLVVFGYTDLYPAARVGSESLDALTIVRLVLLLALGVLIPLSIPGPPSPDPIKSASPWSRLTWGYYDQMILYAARHPNEHLSSSMLPPLDETDDAEYLSHKHFRRIDPTLRPKKRYILWSLFVIFKWDYIAMMTLATFSTFATFLAPVGIKHILSYLESGYSAGLRPWVWVVWIGVGPICYSLLQEWYLAVGTRVLVQTEAIITELVFEHAMRVRIGAEAKEKKSPPTVTSDAASTATTAAGSDNGSTTSAAASTSTTAASTPVDGKAKSTDAKTQDDKATAKQMMGKITNLVTSDLAGLGEMRNWPLLVQSMLSCIVAVVFLYSMLGWSALIGTAVLVLTLPVPAWVAKTMMSSQRNKMKVSDKRVQAVTQTMSVLRMIKLFAWEQKSIEKLTKVRDEELVWVRWNRMLNIVNHNLNNILPLCNILVTLGIYALVMKEELTASRVFTSISVFAILQTQLQMLTYRLPGILNGKVALDRIDAFLNETVLIHEPDDDAPHASPSATPNNDAVGFCEAMFTWDDISDVDPTAPNKGKRDFRLKIDGTILFEPGTINLVVGPTGAGKTSLLLALLGEMYFHPNGPESWYNLPRERGVAYAAQETWVLNETIRENIVFGAAFDEERYKKVLEQCALEQDLALFAAGDLTEVGEKGLTLSGGQKARITLARAVYSHARVVLLDDVLAALDVHTARWVVEKCFKGDLLRDRTVLLVTHNLALTRSIAKKLIHVDGAGRVSEEASITDLMQHDEQLKAELAKAERLFEEAAAEEETEETDTKKEVASEKGKLTVAEEVAHGNVGLDSIMLYLKNVGGAFFWTALLVSIVVEAGMQILQPWWLGRWSNQYEDHPASEVDAKWYLGGYAVFVLLELIVGTIGYILWVDGSIRASRRITRRLIQSIMAATFRWLDTVPVARVITRCTQDLVSLDDMLSQFFYAIQCITVALLAKLAAVIFVIGWRALVMGIIVLSCGFGIGKLYVTVQRSVKREQSVAKSPVLSVFGAGIAGLPSIRAYGAQEYFIKQLRARINVYTRLSRNFYNINRWVGVRIDGLGAVFSATIAAGVVYGNVLNVGNAGFALSQVLGFALEVFYFVRIANMLEVECNSLERIRDFIEIEHEPEPTVDGVPPAYWPASGSLRVEKLSARYGPDSPDVLHDISFEIKSGERVGVVGRTGAGKSTVSLALLRAVITRGQVFFDGIDVQKINLDALRANVTLIPQNPDLLAGTLRENLDPFEEHDDATLNDALRCAGLFRLQQEGTPGAITLDSEVEGGGANFSHGQRQIIALARAQVRRSKLMIMDEATAAIDYETDAAIQESIRTTLGSDVTVITIAHRLQTIMDSDKIIVLDAGRLAEFGSPKDLLAQKQGLFYDLVERSHDKESLYRMVKA